MTVVKATAAMSARRRRMAIVRRAMDSSDAGDMNSRAMGSSVDDDDVAGLDDEVRAILAVDGVVVLEVDRAVLAAADHLDVALVGELVQPLCLGNHVEHGDVGCLQLEVAGHADVARHRDLRTVNLANDDRYLRSRIDELRQALCHFNPDLTRGQAGDGDVLDERVRDLAVGPDGDPLATELLVLPDV